MPPSPNVTRYQFARMVVNDPRFASLSPQAQQVFRTLADPNSATGAVTVPEPLYATAYNEAKQHGFDPFDWRGIALPGGLAAAGVGLGALAGGAGAAPGVADAGTAAGTAAGTDAAATSAGLLPAATTVSPVGALAPALTPTGAGALAAGTTAAAAGGGLWSTIAKLAPIIQAGTGIGGALIGANAQNNATDAQLKATEEALAAQKELYQQQRADLAPYRLTGYSSLNTLRGLTGQAPIAVPGDGSSLGPSANGEQVSGWSAPTYAGPNATSQTWQGPGRNPMYASPQAIANYQGGLAALSPAASAPTITLKEPGGSTRQFRADDPAVSHYLSLPGVEQVNA